MIHQAEIQWNEAPQRAVKEFKSYFNSTKLSGSVLKEATATTLKQNEVILSIFKLYGKLLSPSQVLKYCEIKGYKYLITSVRRSINTLTKENELVHTGRLVDGPYGKPEGLWIYKNSI